MPSYLDLGLHPADVQSAAADALQRQVAGNLAVTPRVSLEGPLRQAIQRRHAAQQLTLGERRLGLKQDELRYSQRQLPWSIAGGVLSGATQVYGGYRALQEQDLRAAEATKQTALMEQIQRESTAATTATVETQGQIRRLLEQQGYPAFNYP